MSLNLVVWGLVLVFLTYTLSVLLTNYFASKGTKDHSRAGETYDGVEEGFAPIPAWWAGAMIVTIVFAAIYLTLFPGMGNYKGLLSWTSEAQLIEKQIESQAVLQEKLDGYFQLDADVLVNNNDAMKLAYRIYQNNCAGCHGRHAQGAKHFPNLTDDAWLYGGDFETIKYSISEGRTGVMPAWEAVLNSEQLDDVSRLVMGEASAEGEQVYGIYCISCHGENKEGNALFGAPNLSDSSWVYGGSLEDIRESIAKGRNGHMPAQKRYLGEEEIHLLAAYLLHLGAKNND